MYCVLYGHGQIRKQKPVAKEENKYSQKEII